MNYEKTQRLILAAPQKSQVGNAMSLQNKPYIVSIAVVQKITEDDWLTKDMVTSIGPEKVAQKVLQAKTRNLIKVGILVHLKVRQGIKVV